MSHIHAWFFFVQITSFFNPSVFGFVMSVVVVVRERHDEREV